MTLTRSCYTVTVSLSRYESLKDNTTSTRQQRYRQQIIEGQKKRLQVILGKDEAKNLEEICKSEGISKTDFVRRAINLWSKE